MLRMMEYFRKRVSYSKRRWAFFSAMADSTRLCILRLLHQKGLMGVTEIDEILEKSQTSSLIIWVA